jgi:hypothetical protein
MRVATGARDRDYPAVNEAVNDEQVLARIREQTGAQINVMAEGLEHLASRPHKVTLAWPGRDSRRRPVRLSTKGFPQLDVAGCGQKARNTGDNLTLHVALDLRLPNCRTTCDVTRGRERGAWATRLS